MKGKVIVTISVLAGCLLWSPCSNADSLIIRFSSGKIQQVTLNEPADAVMKIQTQTTGTESSETAKNDRVRELYKAEDKKSAADNKKYFRLKWGTPRSGE
jgi:cytidylate kinase